MAERLSGITFALMVWFLTNLALAFILMPITYKKQDGSVIGFDCERPMTFGEILIPAIEISCFFQKPIFGSRDDEETKGGT